MPAKKKQPPEQLPIAPHTPGPWGYKVGNKENKTMSDVFRKNQEDFRIAYVICESNSLPARAEDIANAKLIAAAPELLAALQQIRIHASANQCDGRTEDWTIGNEDIRLVEAAIAKATS